MQLLTLFFWWGIQCHGRKKCIPRSLSLARKVGGGKSPGENPPENNKSTTTEVEGEEAKMKFEVHISVSRKKNSHSPPSPAHIFCVAVCGKMEPIWTCHLHFVSSFFPGMLLVRSPHGATEDMSSPFSLSFLLMSRLKGGRREFKGTVVSPKSIPPECEIHRLLRAHVSY